MGALGLPGDSEWRFGTLLVALLVLASSVMVGLVAALAAYLRSERKPSLTALGLLLSLLPVLIVLGLILASD